LLPLYHATQVHRSTREPQPEGRSSSNGLACHDFATSSMIRSVWSRWVIDLQKEENQKGITPWQETPTMNHKTTCNHLLCIPSSVKWCMIDKTKCKTYSSRDSHVVTHRSTNLPFNCLCMAERTGCPVFSWLWPYVLDSKSCSDIYFY
jgi:hypothetical protein